jgi:hypothetical protein
MDNVKFVIIELPQGNKEYAIIDRGNEEFTSMPKSVYDAQQASSTLPSNFADPAEKPKK